jgi:hypothetical protein
MSISFTIRRHAWRPSRFSCPAETSRYLAVGQNLNRTSRFPVLQLPYSQRILGASTVANTNWLHTMNLITSRTGDVWATAVTDARWLGKGHSGMFCLHALPLLHLHAWKSWAGWWLGRHVTRASIQSSLGPTGSVGAVLMLAMFDYSGPLSDYLFRHMTTKRPLHMICWHVTNLQVQTLV